MPTDKVIRRIFFPMIQGIEWYPFFKTTKTGGYQVKGMQLWILLAHLFSIILSICYIGETQFIPF
jgi:hypothetical protein